MVSFGIIFYYLTWKAKKTKYKICGMAKFESYSFMTDKVNELCKI